MGKVTQLQLRRGLVSALPTLAEGELGYATDTKDVYIGTSSGNQKYQANLTGLLSAIPSLGVGQTYFATDNLTVYVGSASGNKPFLMLKSGTYASIGTLLAGQIYHATNTPDAQGGLYVGTASGNRPFGVISKKACIKITSCDGASGLDAEVMYDQIPLDISNYDQVSTGIYQIECVGTPQFTSGKTKVSLAHPIYLDGSSDIYQMRVDIQSTSKLHIYTEKWNHTNGEWQPDTSVPIQLGAPQFLEIEVFY